MNNFSERLKSLRKPKGLTQTALAKAINIKSHSIKHWEKNRIARAN